MLLCGKRLVCNRPVSVGGGLFAELVWRKPFGQRAVLWAVELTLRMRGAGDLRVLYTDWRETAQAAATNAEDAMLRLASALRQAGAT